MFLEITYLATEMKKVLLLVMASFYLLVLSAQSSYIPLGNDFYGAMERLEIKSGVFSPHYNSTIKPYSRAKAIDFMEMINDNFYEDILITGVDRQNLYYISKDNKEWSPEYGDILSKRPVFRRFYKYPAEFYSVDEHNFKLKINPLLHFQLGYEQDATIDDNLFLNKRGIEARGVIGNKIGFYTAFTENQARYPEFIRQQNAFANTVAGEANFKVFNTTGVDYISPVAYITLPVIKEIDLQFGYDKNFIGNGYRSLVLSDNGAPYTFLKLNTKVWRLNYQNIFAEMVAPHQRIGDRVLPKKYGAFHHLSLDVTDRFNIGLFEAVMFDRSNGFELNYLNPVIFYRGIESVIGSGDNVLIGMDFKANIKKRLLLYGQAVVDDYQFFEFIKGSGLWQNKLGGQLGFKYVDALGISNLDAQGEINIVRPYTYGHRDTALIYAHYNQPLAHPAGANFREFIGILNYQPSYKLRFTGKLTYLTQGVDTGSVKYGANIFELYFVNGVWQYKSLLDNQVGQGVQINTFQADLGVTYMLRHNLFFDLNYTLRKSESEIVNFQKTTSYVSAGVRLNMWKRGYDY